MNGTQQIINMMKLCKFRKLVFIEFRICVTRSISFDALVQRYEPPEGRNRWDAPLFEVTPDDQLPFEQIADYLANKRPPPPNKSTVNVRKIFHLLRKTRCLSLFYSYQYRIQIFYMTSIMLLKMLSMYAKRKKTYESDIFKSFVFPF